MKQLTLQEFGNKSVKKQKSKRVKKQRKYFILYPDDVRKEYWETNFSLALEKAGIDKKAWRRKIREFKKRIK